MDSNAARKISADSSERLWFVARANVLKGPFSTSQLQEKVQKRELNYLDFCWRQGFNEWRPMGSVEDFDRRTKFRKLPHYPHVEVPSTSTGGIYLVDTSPPEEEGPARKTFVRGLPHRKKVASHSEKSGEALSSEPKAMANFEVSFARHKRHSISIYEWGLAAIFAVTLAYFSAEHAMREVSKTVISQLAMTTAGTIQIRGETEKGAPQPFAWDPVYSALSFDQMLPLESSVNSGLEDPLRLPVNFEGSPSGYNVKMNIPDPLWDGTQHGLDPIYIRPLRIKGYLNLRIPNEVLVPQRGEPFLVPQAP